MLFGINKKPHLIDVEFFYGSSGIKIFEILIFLYECFLKI